MHNCCRHVIGTTNANLLMDHPARLHVQHVPRYWNIRTNRSQFSLGRYVFLQNRLNRPLTAARFMLLHPSTIRALFLSPLSLLSHEVETCAQQYDVQACEKQRVHSMSLGAKVRLYLEKITAPSKLTVQGSAKPGLYSGTVPPTDNQLARFNYTM